MMCVLIGILLFIPFVAKASGPETCDSVSIGPDNYYFTQSGDSTLHINLTYIGSETLAYPYIRVEMDDTTQLVVDGYYIQSNLQTQILDFTIRYKQPNIPANTSIGGKVRITNPNLNPPLDCGLRLTIHVNGPNGVEATLEQPFRIFPNPTDGILVLESTDAAPQRYQLINSMGQIVRSGTCTTSTTLDLSSLPVGMYYLVHPGGWNETVVLTR